MHDLVRPVGELEQSKVSRAAVAGFGPSKRSSKRSSVARRKGRGVEMPVKIRSGVLIDVKRLTITDNTAACKESFDAWVGTQASRVSTAWRTNAHMRGIRRTNAPGNEANESWNECGEWEAADFFATLGPVQNYLPTPKIASDRSRTRGRVSPRACRQHTAHRPQLTAPSPSIQSFALTAADAAAPRVHTTAHLHS